MPCQHFGWLSRSARPPAAPFPHSALNVSILLQLLLPPPQGPLPSEFSGFARLGDLDLSSNMLTVRPARWGQGKWGGGGREKHKQKGGGGGVWAGRTTEEGGGGPGCKSHPFLPSPYFTAVQNAYQHLGCLVGEPPRTYLRI